MSTDPRSRYFGLGTFLHEGRLTTGQRLLVAPPADERFLLHRLSDTETLDQLALRYYGRDDLWWRIADVNPGRFPLDFRPGDLIRVPLSPRVTRVP